MTDLPGQTLLIPPLKPLLSTWKTTHHPHPLHARLREEVVDPILTSLLSHPKALGKAKRSDTALLVCGLSPSLTSPSDFEKLKTVAIWLVWIVLWDDTIDSASDGSINAEEYVSLSKQYVKSCLLDEAVEEAPTKVCELMGEVGGRLRGVDGWGQQERGRLWGRLGGYLDACLEEYHFRVSGKRGRENEFWGWRTGTSGVGAFCEVGRVMNGGGGVPGGLLEGEEVKKMEGVVNRGFVVINELFSLKKELRDGAFMNLIPIAMHDRNCDLAAAVQGIVQDFVGYIKEFEEQASLLRSRAEREHGGEVVVMVEKTIEAYQAIVTGILDFSINSPRYGIQEYEREDGSFAISL